MNWQNFIENNFHKKSILSYILLPISCLYSQFSRIRRIFCSSNSQFRSRCFVISVGNIVAGGSGKTPFTIFLSNYLSSRGIKVAVSHRGYKGDFENSIKLISDYSTIFSCASSAGDEAYLLAKRCKNIPVVAGKNRKLALRLLEKKFPSLQVVILDDSFQHLKIHHDFDFIIFNALVGVGNNFVLPAGILREPISSLKNANAVIWQGSQSVPDQISKINVPIFRASYHVTKIIDQKKSEINSFILKTKNVILLSGIGVPKSFENTIHELKIPFKKHVILNDHAEYSSDTIRKIEQEARKNEVDYVITTEKDFAKLEKLNHNLPLLIVCIEYQFDDIKSLETDLMLPLLNEIQSN